MQVLPNSNAFGYDPFEKKSSYLAFLLNLENYYFKLK